MLRGEMEVSLEYHTPDPQRVIAMAAWTCYNPDMSGFGDRTDEEIATFVRRIKRHQSTYEFADFIFRVHNVSRALTHQLVRHRLASYAQQSQRYCTYDARQIEFIWPESVLESRSRAQLFDSFLEHAVATYDELVALGVPAEDARYVLPNATPSEIVIKMNARELLHFFNERCCNRAQWEIREMADRMLDQAKLVAPAIFQDAGPDCRRGGCQEGKMSCGKPRK